MTNEKLAQIMGEYLTDPYNCINTQVAVATNLGIPLIGHEQTIGILAAYLGTLLGDYALQTGDEATALTQVDEMSQRLRESVAAVLAEHLPDSESTNDSDDELN